MKRLLTMAASLAIMAAPALATSVFFDYADIRLTFDANTSVLQAADHAGTSVKANLRDNADNVMDQANIASAANFNVLLSAAVANGGGLDDMALAGSMAGSDIDLAADAYKAAFNSAAFGADLDGVTFAGGILTINGVLSPFGAASSILVDPVAGDWIFRGTDDLPTGVGADGQADQFTVTAAARDGFTDGTVFVLEISLPTFRDGASTLGFANADAFFAAALLHDGFDSTGGDMKINITPTPGASALGLVGFCLLSRLRRQVA